jgi:hypothetical protein
MKIRFLLIVLIVVFSISTGMQLRAILEHQAESHVVDVQLYNYGLQFSSAWYNNWQAAVTWADILLMPSLIALVAVSISLLITEITEKRKLVQKTFIHHSGVPPEGNDSSHIAPPEITVMPIKERETVIKEVVLISCQYCRAVIPQTATFCPNCGARRTG